MSAREAVARKLFDTYADEVGHADAEWNDESLMSQDDWCRDADALLAVLKPIIAAAVAEELEDGLCFSDILEPMQPANRIAARICDHTTTGEHQ